MSNNDRQILVVDQDPDVRHMVTSYFAGQNVPAVAAAGRQELERHLAAGNPRLIILDRRIGPGDGLDLLREIRIRCDAAVIVTNDDTGDELDRVVNLELGADDYVIKPFSMRELFARVRAVLRRRPPTDRCSPARSPGRTRSSGETRSGYRFSGWQLDRRSRRLADPNGARVVLTKGEYALLLAFLDAPQRCLTRAHLLAATRTHEDIFDRTIDVQVLRLRRKLEPVAGAPRLIETQRGAGYVFAVPVVAI